MFDVKYLRLRRKVAGSKLHARLAQIPKPADQQALDRQALAGFGFSSEAKTPKPPAPAGREARGGYFVSCFSNRRTCRPPQVAFPRS
jgi:hypothetical protein